MKLQYAKEHLTCCNYARIENKSLVNTIPIFDYNYKKGDTIKKEITDTEIVFMVKGSCIINVDTNKTIVLKTGSMTLLSVGLQLVAEMVEDSHLFICKISPDVYLCEKFSIKNLVKEKEMVNERVYVLNMNEAIYGCINNTVASLNVGLRCIKYMEMKVVELMYLFRAYYTKEELAGFFYPILNNDVHFAMFILKNWNKASSMSQLAELSHLSPSRFGVKFKEVFGVSPYQWLLNRKSANILHELTCTDKSIKQICEELNFSSVQHFNDFCKKQLGTTPGKIRNPQ